MAGYLLQNGFAISLFFEKNTEITTKSERLQKNPQFLRYHFQVFCVSFIYLKNPSISLFKHKLCHLLKKCSLLPTFFSPFTLMHQSILIKLIFSGPDELEILDSWCYLNCSDHIGMCWKQCCNVHLEKTKNEKCI